MSKKLKQKILDVIKKYPVGSVATIRSGKPWVRYMEMKPKDDLTLYSATFASSRKVAQIKKDKNVHVTFGANPKKYALPYVQIAGTAEIVKDRETKQWCWNKFLKQFFDGPEDPDYVVFKITPKLIEYMSPDAMEPKVYKP